MEDATGETEGVQWVLTHQHLLSLPVLCEHPCRFGGSPVLRKYFRQPFRRLPPHLQAGRRLSATMPRARAAPTHDRGKGPSKKPPLGKGCGAQGLHHFAAQAVEGGK